MEEPGRKEDALLLFTQEGFHFLIGRNLGVQTDWIWDIEYIFYSDLRGKSNRFRDTPPHAGDFTPRQVGTMAEQIISNGRGEILPEAVWFWTDEISSGQSDGK